MNTLKKQAHVPSRHGLLSQVKRLHLSALTLSVLILGFAAPLAQAVLPVLPPAGNTTENIVFQDDFSDGNLKGWTNIDTGTSSSAMIGTDSLTGASVWRPTTPANGSTVTSVLTLPSDLDLANGPIAIYARTRVDGGNLVESNRFSIILKEKSPGSSTGSLLIRPGHFSMINTTRTGNYSYPSGTSTFQDFRFVLTKTSTSTVTIDAYYYDTTINAYTSLGQITGASLSSGIFSSLTIWSRNSLGAAFFDSVMVTQVRGSLPMLPPGDNSENIVFVDDFSNGNLKGWSNVSGTSGSAMIGTDSLTGASVWRPTFSGDGFDVLSQLNLPRDLDLASGPVAIYMRVRVDNGNQHDGNRFLIKLIEKTPDNRSGSLTIRPADISALGYRNAAGTTITTPNGVLYSFPVGDSTFQDFRLVLTRTSPSSALPGDYLKLEAFHYDTASGSYTSLGSITGANLRSGIFNQLLLWSRNGSGATGGAAIFDSVMVTQVGGPRASYPANSTFMPVTATAAEIQNALAAGSAVVLAKGTYTATGTLTMQAGYHLYGDASVLNANHGTYLQNMNVVIAAGASNVVVSHLRIGSTGLSFASGASVTQGNVFERLSSAISATDATVRDNLFLDISGPLNFDNSSGTGYLRNNRFIRTRAHAVSPQLVLRGDTNRNSYGNVFLWRNFLTPWTYATDISDHGDLTFVGIDSESWNWGGTASSSAVIQTGRMGTLRLFGVNGGNHRYSATGDGIGADSRTGTADDALPFDNRTNTFNIDADEFQLYDDTMERAGTSVITGTPFIDYQLGPHNIRSLLVNSKVSNKLWSNAASSPFRIKAFDASTSDIATSSSSSTTPSWTIRNSSLSTTPVNEQSILTGMVNPVRSGAIWEGPFFPAIPDPAGPNWATNRATQIDSRGLLQSYINDGIRIPSGIYYIGGPLKIKRNQSLVGSGADNTVIIAMNSTLDMIIADDTGLTSQSSSRSIALADITLQGGKNGLHIEPVGVGTIDSGGNTIGVFDGTGTVVCRAQYTGCYINHVTFRDMDNAGIFMDQIYAFDNNLFSYVNFVNCDTGIKQSTDPLYTGGDGKYDVHAAMMMYVDKCVFYKCQFINSTATALTLPGGRQCGLNAWISCKFQDNAGGAAAMTNYVTAIFANCDFINNGANPSGAVLSNNYSVGLVNNIFNAAENTAPLLGGPVSAEGCLFTRASTNTTVTILKNSTSSTKVFLNNCDSRNIAPMVSMPLGLTAYHSGVFLNTALASESSALNQMMISIKNGVATTIVPGTAAPSEQLLFGSDWSASPYIIKNY